MQNVQPTNKRFLIALDVSLSMQFGSVHGLVSTTPKKASCAFISMFYNIEKQPSPITLAYSAMSSEGVKELKFESYELQDVEKEVNKVRNMSGTAERGKVYVMGRAKFEK